jgi:hypothetical protein
MMTDPTYGTGILHCLCATPFCPQCHACRMPVISSAVSWPRREFRVRYQCRECGHRLSVWYSLQQGGRRWMARQSYKREMAGRVA